VNRAREARRPGMESSSWDGEIIVVSGGSASYLEAWGLSRGQMAGIPLNL